MSCCRQLFPDRRRSHTRSSAMFGGALVSFVKRLFGRAMKSDEASDCQTAATAGGDCNGNVPPPTVYRDPVTTPSTWTARRCRQRGHAPGGRRCAGTGTLTPSAADPHRWTLSRHDDVAADGVEVVCCCPNCVDSLCYYDDGQHPVQRPHVR